MSRFTTACAFFVDGEQAGMLGWKRPCAVARIGWMRREHSRQLHPTVEVEKVVLACSKGSSDDRSFRRRANG